LLIKGQKKFFSRVEVEVERAFGNARLLGELSHRESLIADLFEIHFSRFKYGVTPQRFLFAASRPVIYSND
jgi:hypothetical protein